MLWIWQFPYDKWSRSVHQSEQWRMRSLFDLERFLLVFGHELKNFLEHINEQVFDMHRFWEQERRRIRYKTKASRTETKRKYLLLRTETWYWFNIYLFDNFCSPYSYTQKRFEYWQKIIFFSWLNENDCRCAAGDQSWSIDETPSIRHLDFHRREYNWFPIDDRDRVKHRKILRNWTDPVARENDRQTIRSNEILRWHLHRQFHHRRPTKNHHV